MLEIINGSREGSGPWLQACWQLEVAIPGYATCSASCFGNIKLMPWRPETLYGHPLLMVGSWINHCSVCGKDDFEHGGIKPWEVHEWY